MILRRVRRPEGPIREAALLASLLLPVIALVLASHSDPAWGNRAARRIGAPEANAPDMSERQAAIILLLLVAAGGDVGMFGWA
jgi:hypothetical protein